MTDTGRRQQWKAREIEQQAMRIGKKIGEDDNGKAQSQATISYHRLALRAAWMSDVSDESGRASLINGCAKSSLAVARLSTSTSRHLHMLMNYARWWRYRIMLTHTDYTVLHSVILTALKQWQSKSTDRGSPGGWDSTFHVLELMASHLWRSDRGLWVDSRSSKEARLRSLKANKTSNCISGVYCKTVWHTMTRSLTRKILIEIQIVLILNIGLKLN